jgi:hypothetical protein
VVDGRAPGHRRRSDGAGAGADVAAPELATPLKRRGTVKRTRSLAEERPRLGCNDEWDGAADRQRRARTGSQQLSRDEVLARWGQPLVELMRAMQREEDPSELMKRLGREIAAAGKRLEHRASGPRVIEHLLPAIRDSHVLVRNNAMRVIGMSVQGHPELVISIEPFLDALRRR